MTTLSSVERRALDAVDVARLVSCVGALVAERSCDGEETGAQRVVAARLRESGIDVDDWTIDLDALSAHPSFSTELARREAIGVVGAIGRGAGPTLILNGHVDVVPAGDLANWSVPPWQATVREGRVFGRGALDMKGGLACALAVARAIRAAGIELQGRLLIQSVVGEEDGGLGTLAAILRGYRGDGAIVMEPTELAVAPAQGGALNFRVTVRGRAAHGALREEGVSAFEKFLPVHAAIVELERRRNRVLAHPLFTRYRLPAAIAMGVVRAGDWASNVPETLLCEGRYGVGVDESPAEARREFEDAVARAADGDPWLQEHQPIVEWWGGQFAPASIPATHPLVTTVGTAFTDATGRPVRVEGMTYGADMRLLVHDGATPTVLFGPGDIRRAHRPDEYVDIADLVAVARTLALTAIRFCGAAG